MDPISDLLAGIRNASMARHASLKVPYSRIKQRIVEILKDEGYLEGFSVEEGPGIRKYIAIQLRYVDGVKPAIIKMRRVSKQGCRVYSRKKDIPAIKSGLGTTIVSTSKGILSDRNARRLNLGGEILCEIW